MLISCRPKSMFSCLYAESLVGLVITLAVFMHFGSQYLRQSDIEVFVQDGISHAQHYLNSRYEPQGLYERLNRFQHLTFYDYTLSLESNLDENQSLCDDCTLYSSSQGVKVYMDADDLLHTALPLPNSTKYLVFREIEDPFIAAVPWYKDREVRFMLTLFVTMSLALALLIYLPLHRVNKRINRLISVQERFGQGELHIRADDYHISPIKEIAQSFNSMADDIERLVKQGQIFAHAFPHEIRTPLSKIQMACDLVQRQDCPNRDQLFNDIDGYIQDICSLSADIHQLSRLSNESGFHTSQPDKTVISLKEFCANRLNMIASCDVQLEVKHNRVMDSLSLPVTLAKLVLDNLVKNGDRYGNGLVKITIDRADIHWIIDVEDNGVGIPEDKRSEIFLAFSRLDASRNANNGGFGLGLAIANSAAKLLNWTISVSDSDLGGAKFRLSIRDE